MEIKTCEEYVLARLAAAEAKLEQVEEDRKKLLASAREEVSRLQGIINYSEEVIKELANFVVIKKDDNLPDMWSVEPTGHKITLDLKRGEGLQTFIRLVPFVGDAGARELLQKMIPSESGVVKKEQKQGQGVSKQKRTQSYKADHKADHKDDHKGAEAADAKDIKENKQ